MAKYSDGPGWVDGYIQIGDGRPGTAIGAYARAADWLYVGFSFYSPDDKERPFVEEFGRMIAAGRLHAGTAKQRPGFLGRYSYVPRRFCVKVSPLRTPEEDAEFAFTMIPLDKLPKRHRQFWRVIQRVVGDKYAARYEPF